VNDAPRSPWQEHKRSILLALGGLLALFVMVSIAFLVRGLIAGKYGVLRTVASLAMDLLVGAGSLACFASAFGWTRKLWGNDKQGAAYDRSIWVALQSPILVREMRALLRGRKFFVSHMLLMTILAGVLLIAATTAAAGASSDDPAQVGKTLFWAFFMGLSVVVIFLVPAFSCTAITTEREGKTLDLLLTTTIRPWEIVWGKLLSALVVILLFMASALPLVTVCFLFGGVSPWDLAILYLGVLFSTLVVSSVSLSVSAHCKESKSAVVISYVLTLIIVVLVVIAVVAMSAAFMGRRGAGAIAAVMTGFDWKQQLLIMVIPQFLGISIFAANFAAATNRLKPATANRSTNLRVIWSGFLFLCLCFYMATIWVQWSLKEIGAGDWQWLSVVTLCCSAPLFWLGTLYFPSEETILPPRVADDCEKLSGPLLPLRLFMPGPLTGVAYSVFFLFLALGGMTLFNSMCALGAGEYDWVWRNVSAAVPLALFLLTTAGIAALFSSFGFTHRGAGLAAFGLTAVLAFGPLILLLCEDAISGPAVSTLWNLHYLSPIVAMVSGWEVGGPAFEEVILPGGTGVPLWTISAGVFAITTLGVWAWADLRVVRVRARWRRQLAAGAASEAARRGLAAAVPVARPVKAAGQSGPKPKPQQED
jgi:ABC-type transport system involved in multi-copper enzyme maturation permease subunit